MKLSDNGLAFLKRMEGFRPHVYKDSAGLPTIGYGHLIKLGEDFSGGIDDVRATQLLERDVAIAVRAVDDTVKVPLTQNQFDALVSFTFNVGGANLKRSTLIRLINEGRAKDAAAQFLRWDKAAGRVIEGLIGRREAERSIFKEGDSTASILR